MKKKLIITIMVGFASVILGLVFIGIGYFSGGFERLEKISAPEQITKTYTDLSTINLDFPSQEIAIQESDDEQFHVSYAKSKNNLYNSLRLTHKNGELTLSSNRKVFQIKGFLQVFGELLDQSNRRSHAITIKIPKNKKLNKLEGHNSTSIFIKNTSIHEVNLTSDIELDNVQIDGGQINSRYAYIDHSMIKNTKFSSAYGNSSITLSHAHLENVEMKDYFQLDATDLKLTGKNRFTPMEHGLTVTNLDFADKSLANLSLNINNTIDKKAFAKENGHPYDDGRDLKEIYEEDTYLQDLLQHVGIFTKEPYGKLPVTKKDNKQTLHFGNQNGKNSLSIQATNATINLRTPKP